MAHKRAAWGSGSIVSDAATESSRGGSFLGSDMTATSTIEGWMYWKRDQNCWLKVYVVLRNELLFLTRGERSTKPLIQIAVTWVSMSSIGGFCAQGTSGEKMELYLYDQDQAIAWYNALIEASSLTKNLEETLAQETVPKSIRRAASIVYAGTLVEYHQDQTKAKAAWKSVLSASRLRHSWRKRVERLIDRLEGSGK